MEKFDMTFSDSGEAEERPRLFVQYKKGFSRLGINRRELEAVLAAMTMALEESGSSIAGIDLYVVNDATINEINREYMNCPGPTNILSFPGGGDMRGTLFLSVDTLLRECFLYGQETRGHLRRLLGHGCGHLAGYEHGAAMDAICEKCLHAADPCLR